MAGILTCWSFWRNSAPGGSAVDKNSASSANATPYTSSAAETLPSSFKAVCRPQ